MFGRDTGEGPPVCGEYLDFDEFMGFVLGASQSAIYEPAQCKAVS